MSIAESSASNRFEDPIQVIATTYLADFDESTDQITIVFETQDDKLSIEVYQGELLHLAASINSLQVHGFKASSKFNLGFKSSFTRTETVQVDILDLKIIKTQPNRAEIKQLDYTPTFEDSLVLSLHIDL